MLFTQEHAGILVKLIHYCVYTHWFLFIFVVVDELTRGL